MGGTVRLNTLSSATGRKRGIKELWQDFFSNPSQWWDHRSEKGNPRFPDFRHKQTWESLWLVDKRNPVWVQAEVAAIQPGTLQLNVFPWNQRLKRYVKDGDHVKTLEVFHQMQQEGIISDARTFLPVLNACARLGSLEEGRCVHAQVIQVGCESDVYVANCLIDMYAKCGSIEDAWRVFNKMPEHNVVTWNAIIWGYVKSGQGLKVKKLFQKMQQDAVEPNAVTFMAMLNACASVVALEEGRRIHEQVIRSGLESDVSVGSCLVDMYAKCGSIDDAWRVFSKLPTRDVIAWSAVIWGYVKSGQGLKALDLFRQMQQEAVEPNAVTFMAMLNACGSIGALGQGKCIHRQVSQRSWESDVIVGSCLVDMYAKCGSIEDAWSVFKRMPVRNVVTWNAMIGGYVKSGQGLKAMELYQMMHQEGVEPTTVTFVAMLNACANIGGLEEGRRIHEQIIGRGCEYDVFVGSCLVDMYAKCGSVDNAWSVFEKMPNRDVVAWGAMIWGYIKSGQGLKALDLSRQLQQAGVEPNAIIFGGMLNACASLAALELGRDIHVQVSQKGMESDVLIGSCLVDMYAKCGCIEDAWSVFNKMPSRNVVAWGAIISGHVRSGQGLKALDLSRQMQHEAVEPDAVTFIAVLNACASVAALEEGKHVHKQIIIKGCESDDFVGSSLVDMYAKCGSIEDACSVFNRLPRRTDVAWSAMIAGYSTHGYAKRSIRLFKRMCKEGVEVDGITLIHVLSACSRRGLVKEGLRYFESMSSHYSISPTMEHYACMVDLLARSGRLEGAEQLMTRMPFEPGVSLWMPLLGACRIHGNIEMAERTAKRCWQLDPGNASAHVLLSNTYAAGGQCKSITTIQGEELKVKRTTFAWVEV